MILFTPRKDTPWDEPTVHSPEFCRYVSGSIFAEHPWRRLDPNALCESILYLIKSYLLMDRVALIRGMMTIDPLKRLTLVDVQSHPWVMR